MVAYCYAEKLILTTVMDISNKSLTDGKILLRLWRGWTLSTRQPKGSILFIFASLVISDKPTFEKLIT